MSVSLAFRWCTLSAKLLLLLPLMVGLNSLAAGAQEEALTLERLFASPEFSGEELHLQDGFRWSPDGSRIA